MRRLIPACMLAIFSIFFVLHMTAADASAQCGNGIVDPGEGCDPPGLCCSAQCQCEVGAICPGGGTCNFVDGNCLCTDVPPLPLDHYTIYQAFGDDGGLVRLRDQFQTQTVRLGQTDVFVVPADKNFEGIFDPIAHETCYVIPEGQFAADVLIDNQFGIQQLSIGNPVVLCTPTEKFPDLAVPFFLERDHYKCYEATGPTLQIPLVLQDQFLVQDIASLQPVVFCTPVEKSPDSDGDGIVDHEDNCVNVPNGSQLDADGDGIGNACDCDFDQNGTCGFPDFSIFLVCFGQAVPGAGPPNDPTCAESDMDGNLTVGFGDFTLFLAGFGGPPGPSKTPPPALFNPVQHLTCYDTLPRIPAGVGPIVIRNQFHQLATLDVLDPIALCVPSLKLEVTFGCEDTFPVCDGSCPPGEVCVPDPGGLAACICGPASCDQSPWPQCGGPCPPDEECVPDPFGFCNCLPIPCDQSPFPQCLGDCPPDEVCVPGAAGAACACEPAPCEQSLFPQCGGPCPPGEVCVPDPGGLAACICEPIPCEQSPAPECLGPCPPDEVCVPIGPGAPCRCEPDPNACGNSPFPECLGDCPPGELCFPNAIDLVCTCLPAPPCDLSPFPQCGGDCPPGEQCAPDPFNPVCRCGLPM